jgi:hypothetical protein
MGAGGPGIGGLLKDGYKHFSGLEEAVLQNVQAAKDLSAITRTSLGPNGTCFWPEPCGSARLACWLTTTATTD